MMKPLRKRHLQIWILLALLIPAGIIAGWKVVPEIATAQLLQPEAGKAFPVLVKSIKRKNFGASLYTNEDKTQYQLVWINKEISMHPSGLIYLTREKEVQKRSPPDDRKALEGAELIGRVESKGNYYFPLKPDSANNFYYFILYDIIKKKIIDTLNFGQ